jgi:hypothetical protein
MAQHDTLPLPDYDHLPLETLKHRIRALDAGGVQTLLEYERAHGDRAPVVTVLENRLDALRGGAQPSDGNPFDEKPEAPPPPAGGSKVSPATAGPPVTPPVLGDPRNPSQPHW